MSTPTPVPPPAAAASAGSALNSLRIDRGAAAQSPRRRRPLWIAGGVLAASAVAALGWQAWPRSVAVQVGTVVTTTPSQQYVVLTASGYVVAQRRAAVASKATGRLLELRVREGSRVRAGELLARLDASDVQASKLAAQAGARQAEAGWHQAQDQLLNAQAELTRSQGLQAQGFISPQAVDAAQTRESSARAALASARAAWQLAQAQVQVQAVAENYTEIRAPFDGVVLVKNANVGDIITPLSSAAGTQGAVVTMADMSSLEVEADVSESSLSKAAAGQPAEITLDAMPGTRFLGHVVGLVPTVDRAKATVTTKVRFDHLDPRILPEMSAKVSLLSHAVGPADEAPVMAVPLKALHSVDGRDVVWLLQVPGQTADAAAQVAADAASAAESPSWILHAVGVRRGRMLGDVQEVTPQVAGELHPNDKVVLQSDGELHEGRQARVAE